MFSKETLKGIAQLIKVDEAAFLAVAEAAEEKPFDIPKNIIALTTDDLANRDKEKERMGHSRGTNDALEKFIKEKKTELGLEFEGKDPTQFMEAYQAKALAEAKITPDEKIKEKDKAIQTLQQTVNRLEREKQQEVEKVSTIKVETSVLTAIPANLKNGMEPSEVLTVMRSAGYDFKNEEGTLIAYKAGEKIADTALKPLPVKDVVNSYLAERKWLDDGASASRNGRGESSSKPGAGVGAKPTKYSEAVVAAKGKGINEGTADFQRYIDEVSKDNKEFAFDD